MSELVDLNARKLRDLLVPTNIGADLDLFKNVKIPAGGMPSGFSLFEGFTLIQIISLLSAYSDKYFDPMQQVEFNARLAELMTQFQVTANQLVAQGFYKGYTTENLLLADKPNVAEMRARADDTRKIWRWVRTSDVGTLPVAGTWTDTGKSDWDLAKEYADNQKVQKYTAFNKPKILYEVVDAFGNQTWLQVAKEDGKPTDYAKDAIRESLNTFLNKAAFIGGELLLYSIQDSTGKPTALTVRKSDGMFPDFVIEDIASRLNITPEDPELSVKDFQYRPEPSDFQILSSIARGVARHVASAPLPTRVTNLTTSTGQAIRITFPNTYSDATPLILVICFEGIGDYSLDMRAAYSELSNQGVVWVRCTFHGDHYGNPKAMADAKEAYQKVCAIAPIGGVIVVGNSMGGVAAFNALTTEAVPNILGLYLTDPVFDLRQRYDNGRAGVINTAYECTAETYLEKTKGYDPAVQHWTKFKGLPIKVLATSNDTLVSMAAHTNKMFEKLKDHNDVQVIDTQQPNHNSPGQFVVSELLNFIQKCSSGAIITTI